MDHSEGGQQRASPVQAAWFDALARHPHAHDLFLALRHIDAAHPQLPRLGTAARPADEPVRVVQPAEMSFAAAAITGYDSGTAGSRPQLEQRVFGLLGSFGPLPLHLTELIRERSHQAGDHTLQAFADLLTQRFVLLFYRAWAQAQPVVGLDRAERPDIGSWLGALFGIGEPLQSERDAAGDAAKLAFAGRLARQVRDADGLLSWCRLQFDVPLRIRQWCGHWMALAPADRSRLRRRGTPALGCGATLGSSVWDVQHKFRIEIGPLSLAEYQRFLPGGSGLGRLQAMVRQWVGLEFEWDLRLILIEQDVPRLQLGAAAAASGTALGRASWLGHYRRQGPADDLLMDVERILSPERLRRRAAARSTASRAADLGGVHQEEALS